MDPTGLTAFLAPFLPYLLTAGKEFGEDAARTLGAAAWDHARQLWACLRPAIEGRPAADEAARDVASAPDDDRARAALELQLEKLLSADQSLKDALAELWREGEPARAVIASGERSVAIGGSVQGSVIQTGDRGRGG
jgi:hypothetical protein